MYKRQEQGSVAGRHNGLPVLHAAEQIRLPRIVQFAEHIVQQHHRVLSRNFLGAGCLGQLQTQHRRALLTLAGKTFGVPPVQKQAEILPVGSHRAEPRRQITPAHRPNPLKQRFVSSKAGFVLNFQCFFSVRNITVYR